ncbi:response regulator [Novosphingobium sp. FSW06-99]|uniref:response regulator n=1 Tax=Novosphingobium sp. FSW06-99 TaxID=1739113 RepID=UPI0009EAFDA9|nr:response regulator [Novosphingobium sp. FSW06-99]
MPKKSQYITKNPDESRKQVVIVIDDDPIVSAGFVIVLEDAGYQAMAFGSGEDLFGADCGNQAICVLLDVSLPGISGVETLHRLRAAGNLVPVIMITGSGSVAIAVEAMKAGACDFIEKPASDKDILEAIARALAPSPDNPTLDHLRADAAKFLGQLTKRQRQILDLIMEGYPNKNIATDLKLSQRTVESHRAIIMDKAGVKSLPALTRLMFAASLPLQPASTTAISTVLGHQIEEVEVPNEVDRDRFERFFEQIPLAVVVSTLITHEHVIYANPAFEALSGQVRSEIEGQPWGRLRGSSVGRDQPVALGDAITAAPEVIGTFQIDRPDGSASLIDLFSSIISDDEGNPEFRLAALVDVAPRDSSLVQEFEVQMREKDMRLLEMQHRVKNNLQMITALVRVEARKARNQDESGMFDRLAGRINSIQLVYKLLSESGQREEVDLGVYLSDVASSIMHASAMEGIRLELKVDSYPVSVNVALPTGMVVNELMTNSLKHAFVDRDSGTILIHSLSDERGRRVVVADDGVGLPPDVSWPKHGKLGALIVQSLRQNAKADLAVDSQPGRGVRFTITFA